MLLCKYPILCNYFYLFLFLSRCIFLEAETITCHVIPCMYSTQRLWNGLVPESVDWFLLPGMATVVAFLVTQCTSSVGMKILLNLSDLMCTNWIWIAWSGPCLNAKGTKTHLLRKFGGVKNFLYSTLLILLASLRCTEIFIQQQQSVIRCSFLAVEVINLPMNLSAFTDIIPIIFLAYRLNSTVTSLCIWWV